VPRPDLLRRAGWTDLPNWAGDDHAAALRTLRHACATLERQEAWRATCGLARSSDAERDPRRWFENTFRPWQLVNADGSDSGLVTGYYEPLLRGSRTRSGPYQYPVLGAPDDLITVDLGSVVPESANLRLRGRIEGNRLVPYYTRGDIEAGRAPTSGRELLWVDDPVELFFLQVQGSGRVQLPDGSLVRVLYANQNGYPYRSIGRVLIDRGELKASEASMPTIRAWAMMNPARVRELLDSNDSYVFFRLAEDDPRRPDLGAPGALGIPLIAGRSVAIDPRIVPLGAPLYLSTTRPSSAAPLERTVLALDTGSAITGAVRADFYWGFGEEADREAGRMRQSGRLWVMLPRDWVMAAN
jgi:membrane-bound lytic murein transglycosylase A